MAKSPEFVYVRTRGPKSGVARAVHHDGYRKGVEESHEVLATFPLTDDDAGLSLTELEAKYPLPPHLYTQQEG